jgi:mercuric ion binding protein
MYGSLDTIHLLSASQPASRGYWQRHEQPSFPVKGNPMKLLAKFCITALLSLSYAFAGEVQTAVMELQKIQCYGCMLTVQKALQKVPGVKETKLDLEQKTATVKYDSSQTNTEALAKATANAGFPSTVRKPPAN